MSAPFSFLTQTDLPPLPLDEIEKLEKKIQKWEDKIDKIVKEQERML